MDESLKLIKSKIGNDCTSYQAKLAIQTFKSL